jgi:hypothetical protein
MARVIEVMVQQWNGSNYSERCQHVENDNDLNSMILNLQDIESATLRIECNDKSLIVGASRGLFTACAILGFDDIWDMQAMDPQAGTLDFIEGGQTVNLPTNLAISVEQAISAAKEFYGNGSVNVEYGWKKQ